MRSYYLIFDLEPDASPEDVRRATRRVLALVHPDKHGESNVAGQCFKALSVAAEVLTDPAKRALYDEFGDAALEADFDITAARERARRPDPDVVVPAILPAEALRDGCTLTVPVPGYQRCRSCRSTGRVLWRCSACQGQGLVRAVMTCFACTGTGAAGYPFVAPCRVCRGAGRVAHPQTCGACGGVGGTPGACDNCQGSGVVLGLVARTVTIPAGTRHGALVRVRDGIVAGAITDEASDYGIRVLLATGSD